jgi:hypothetical protein
MTKREARILGEKMAKRAQLNPKKPVKQAFEELWTAYLSMLDIAGYAEFDDMDDPINQVRIILQGAINYLDRKEVERRVGAIVPR